MNPFPVVFSLFGRHRLTLTFFVVLITFSVALGIAVTTQERALRQGTARAADKFDVVVGAPGSPIDLVLATVYARPAAMGLIPPAELSAIMGREDVEFAAPIAFGDSVMGFPLMGTTQVFIDHLSGPIGEGRAFAKVDEAVLGANVPLQIGQLVNAAHSGLDSEAMLHTDPITIVGRMARTNSAWDNVVVVPVEQVWETHAHHEDGEAGETEADETHGDHDRDHDHDHEHGEALGGPFDTDNPGVPAIVIKPANVAAAYALRSELRSGTTQALFPAEVLVQLYALLGDARAILGVLALATQLLVVAAILSGIMIVLQLHAVRFAVLRALGATRAYVFLVAWTYIVMVIAVGAALGLALGLGLSWVVSYYLQGQTGIIMPVTLTWAEVQLALAIILCGSLLAVVPAVAIYRRPVAEGLR